MLTRARPLHRLILHRLGNLEHQPLRPIQHNNKGGIRPRPKVLRPRDKGATALPQAHPVTARLGIPALQVLLADRGATKISHHTQDSSKVTLVNSPHIPVALSRHTTEDSHPRSKERTLRDSNRLQLRARSRCSTNSAPSLAEAPRLDSSRSRNKVAPGTVPDP